MRKSVKALLAVGAIVATPAIINHIIAKKAQKRIDKRVRESVYGWEYGDIRYITAGKDGAPPLLLIHGIYPGASSLEWEGVMEQLAGKYKVYALDLLGFGYSSKPALDYCCYFYVRLIKDFIENVIGQKVTAVASLHSAAALTVCAAFNPEDFEKILLVSPTGLEGDTPLSGSEDGMVKKALETPIAGTLFYNLLCSKKALPEFFEKTGLVGEFDKEKLDKIYLAAHAEGASGKYAVASLLSKLFNADVRASLSELEVPYHIILGEHQPGNDSFVVWNGIDESYPATIIEGAYLLPHMENPEDFCEACKNLL